MPILTGGQALVKSLRAEGVEVVFAVPGVQVMEAFDAFYDESGIRLVTVRHEQATTYMADGYARATGKVGVGMVVPGPGALNATAGLGTAYACSSPVLLISGQIDSPSLGKLKGQLHEVHDQLDVFRPLTKWCHRVLEVAEIPQAVHEAMRRLRTGRPRPVELEIPVDVLAATAEVAIPQRESYPPTTPDAGGIRDAAELLLNARYPAIWAGGGAVISDAGESLLALAEFLQAPIMTTPEGKGAVPEDHPLSLGCSWYRHGPAHEVIARSDVVLAVGTRFNYQAEEAFRLGEGQCLVHIDIDPEEIGRNHPADVGIVADAWLALEALVEHLRDAGQPRLAEGGRLAEFQRLRQQTQEDLRAVAPRQMSIVEDLRSALDRDAIVVGGVTNIGSWCSVALPVYQPRTFLTSSYFATLGYAFPTAIGAKIAQPHRQVVALCGDGGFLYGVAELATAVRERVGLVAIVFADGAFGASLHDQRIRFKGRVIGTQLHNPDLVKLAESFGARGIRVEPEGLAPALREALDSGSPTVIEVPVPNMNPPFQTPRHVRSE